MSILGSAFDCLKFCCGSPEKCDAVCRRNPDQFISRLREVDGFDLASIARFSKLELPTLPNTIPLIYHGNRRTNQCRCEAVALPLYRLYDRRTGNARFTNRDQLAAAFGFHPSAKIVLTGVHQDRSVESWWRLANSRLIADLRALGIALVTTPNYSLFVDVPRWDNLHAIKRIALSWEQLMSFGIPAAIHLNARTDEDYRRYTDFIATREEIDWVSFEFGTGAGWPGRIDWHVEHLCLLATSVRRPLSIIVRGGIGVLRDLRSAFAAATLIDTTSFTKTLYRQRGILSDGKLEWISSRTEPAAVLDSLLTHNITVFDSYIQSVLAMENPTSSASSGVAPHGGTEAHAASSLH